MVEHQILGGKQFLILGPKSRKMMKQFDCVSYAVNRFLEPLTECASVSDEKDRYYT